MRVPLIVKIKLFRYELSLGNINSQVLGADI